MKDTGTIPIKLTKRSLKDRLKYIDENAHKMTPLMYECMMDGLVKDWNEQKMREDLK